MRKNLICAAIAIGGAAAIGLSKDSLPNNARPAREPEHRHERGHEEAEKKLREVYGATAESHVTDSYEVDGVRVFNAIINRPGFTYPAESTVTGSGELITIGLPVPPKDVSAGAMETAQLFKTPFTSITLEDLHGYFVTVRSAGQPYEVEFDAAGRIRDIKASEAIEEDSQLHKVEGPMRHQMSEMTAKRFGDAVIDHVFEAKHDPGYYLVVFRAQKRTGWAIINPANDVTEYRVPLHRDQIPEAVWRGIDRELRGDHVSSVSKGVTRVYQIKQMVGGEQIVMHVRPNGSVAWMSSSELHRHYPEHH